MTKSLRCRCGHTWAPRAETEDHSLPAVCPQCQTEWENEPAENGELPPPPKRFARTQTLSRESAATDTEIERSVRLEPGSEAGDFHIVRELGQGGMAIVYLARQKSLNRSVALKVLSAEGSAQTETLRRFRREAEAVARLQHPQIVQIFEIGTLNERPFLALEYIDGGTLAHYISGTPCPAVEAAALLEVIARAVHFAHGQGIVHRDLKPANILLARPAGNSSESVELRHDTVLAERAPLSGFLPKVGDFGLAKDVGADTGQTHTGVVLGTPSYMAPEQAEGQTERIGPAADVYALGAILYEMLTGRPPFRGTTTWETVQQVIADEPVAPSRLQSATPRDLETICLKCLQKEPAQRYGSAAELADDLRRYLDGHPIVARPVGPVERLRRWGQRNPVRAALSAALAVAIIVGAAGVLWQWQRAEREKVNTGKERDEANQARITAQNERATARAERDKAQDSLRLANKTIRGFVELVDYLDDSQLFYVNFIDIQPEVMEAQVAHTQEFIRQNRDRSDRRVELADAYARLATFERKLQRFAQGISDARAALAIRQALARERPDVIEFERDLAACHQLVGLLHHARGLGATPEHSRAGLPDLETALMIRKSIFEREPLNLEYRSELANCYNTLALLHVGMAEYEKTIDYLQRAIQHQDAAYSAAPQIARYRLSLTNHYFNLATAFIRLDRPTEAVAAGRRCRDLGPNETEQLVRLGRILSQASAVVGAENSKPASAGSATREQYAAEAVAQLRLAIDKGYDNVNVIANPPANLGLGPVVSRTDYKELVAYMKDKLTRQGKTPVR